MGGGTFGNVTAAAEFNIWADPEAAEIVFSYGGKLVMSGLDVTHELQATPERIAKIRSHQGQLATVVADLLVFFSDGYMRFHLNMNGGAVHDPCAVMALTHPELFTITPERVKIETAGDRTRGMTVIDRRGHRKPAPSNCDVVWNVDDEAAFDVLIEAIGHFSK